MRKKYVAAFLFSRNGAVVALVKKEKPDWQKGKWNAIGGKIEPGETPGAAVQREFREETGVDIQEWNRFCVLIGNDSNYNNSDMQGEFEVHFYSCFSNRVYLCETMEKELVDRHDVAKVSQLETIPNLKWLIPLALERGLRAKVFEANVPENAESRD